MTAQPHPRVCSGSVLVLVLVLRRLRGAATWQTLAVFHPTEAVPCRARRVSDGAASSTRLFRFGAGAAAFAWCYGVENAGGFPPYGSGALQGA